MIAGHIHLPQVKALSISNTLSRVKLSHFQRTGRLALCIESRAWKPELCHHQNAPTASIAQRAEDTSSWWLFIFQFCATPGIGRIIPERPSAFAFITIERLPLLCASGYNAASFQEVGVTSTEIVES